MEPTHLPSCNGFSIDHTIRGAKYAANAAKEGSLDSSFRRYINVSSLPTRDFKAWQAFNYDLIVFKADIDRINIGGGVARRWCSWIK
jgi:hypothetical protein